MKKKFIFRRRTPMTLRDMSFNCIGIERYKPRGKAIKVAMNIIGYGGGLKRALKVSGLSLRRIKVAHKKYFTMEHIPSKSSRIFGNIDLPFYPSRHSGKSVTMRQLKNRPITIQPTKISPFTEIVFDSYEMDVGKAFKESIIDELKNDLEQKIHDAFFVPYNLRGEEDLTIRPTLINLGL